MTIFLDIDGVLNQLQAWHIDRNCVKILSEVCEKLNAEVVLTSSWRLGYSMSFERCTPQIQNLITICKEFGIKIVGRTRDLKDRQEEVLAYCETYGISDYLVIDDERSLFKDLQNLYIVNYKTGLQEQDIKKILNFIK